MNKDSYERSYELSSVSDQISTIASFLASALDPGSPLPVNDVTGLKTSANFPWSLFYDDSGLAPAAVEENVIVGANKDSLLPFPATAEVQKAESVAAPSGPIRFRPYISPRERALAARARASQIECSNDLRDMTKSSVARGAVLSMLRAAVGIESALFARLHGSIELRKMLPRELQPYGRLVALAASAGSSYLSLDRLVEALGSGAARTSVHVAVGEWLRAFLGHYAARMTNAAEQASAAMNPSGPAPRLSVAVTSASLQPHSRALAFLQAALHGCCDFSASDIVDSLLTTATQTHSVEPLSTELVADLCLPKWLAADSMNRAGRVLPAPPSIASLAMGVLRAALSAYMSTAYSGLRLAPNFGLGFYAERDCLSGFGNVGGSIDARLLMRATGDSQLLFEATDSLSGSLAAAHTAPCLQLPATDYGIVEVAVQSEMNAASLVTAVRSWAGMLLTQIAAACPAGAVSAQSLAALSSCARSDRPTASSVAAVAHDVFGVLYGRAGRPDCGADLPEAACAERMLMRLISFEPALISSEETYKPTNVDRLDNLSSDHHAFQLIEQPASNHSLMLLARPPHSDQLLLRGQPLCKILGSPSRLTDEGRSVTPFKASRGTGSVISGTVSMFGSSVASGSPSSRVLGLSAAERRALSSADARTARAVAARREDEERHARLQAQKAELSRLASAASEATRARQQAKDDEKAGDAERARVAAEARGPETAFKPSVRVTQPSGGAESAVADALRTSVRILQPAGGGASQAFLNNDVTDLASTHRAAVRVSQPSGGVSSVAAYLSSVIDASADVDLSVNGSAARAPIPLGADTADASLDAADYASVAGSLSLESVRTHVRVSQPAGGASTVASLLAYDAQTAVDALSIGHRLRRFEQRSEVSATLVGSEPVRLPALTHVAVSQPPGGASSLDRVLFGGAYSDSPARQAALQRVRGAASPLGGASGSNVSQLQPPDPVPSTADALPVALFTPDTGSSWVSSILFGSDALPHEDAPAALPAARSASTARLQPSWDPPQLSAPLSVVVQEALVAPLYRCITVQSSAAVAALLLQCDLLGHLSALRAWMLMGHGHVFGSVLDSVMPVVAPLGPGPDTPSPLSMAPGALVDASDPNQVAAFANACLGWAQADHGLRAHSAEFSGELARRLQLSRQSPSDSDAARSDAEKLAMLRLQAQANCRAPPSVAHMHRFAYIAAASTDTASHILDAVQPEYVLGTDSLRLLTHALSPRLLARFGTAHRFMMRLRSLAWRLKRAWLGLTRLGGQRLTSAQREGPSRRRAASRPPPPPAVHDLLLLRHEAAAVVAAIDAFVSAQLHGGFYPTLLHALASSRDATSLHGVVGLLEAHTRGMLERCLLPEPPAAEGASSGQLPHVSPLARGSALVDRTLSIVGQLCSLIEAQVALAQASAGAGPAFDEAALSSTRGLRDDLRRRVHILCSGLEGLARAEGGPLFSRATELLESLRAATAAAGASN